MLVDSWAWIEAFDETPKSAFVRDALGKSRLYTSALSLAEVACWCVRNGHDPQPYLTAIKSNAVVLEPDAKTCEEGVTQLPLLRRSYPRFGIVDSIIYATARIAGILLFTGDPHFRHLPGVKFIE